MKRVLLPLLLCMLAPSVAFAWDFSCSPKNVTEIEPLLPPQLMIMLDRSGSMDNGEITSTCNVCQHTNGAKSKVSSAAECTSPSTYLGTITDSVCGKKDKWEQAVSAIDAVTAESQASSPELAAFGLAMFTNSSASIYHECALTNHDPIMRTLDGTGPSGNTPTAYAIRTSLSSNCLNGVSTSIIKDEQFFPYDETMEGIVYKHTLSIPPQTANLTADIYLQGNYGKKNCEYAEVYIDGAPVGRHDGGNKDCDESPTKQSFTIPASATTDGVVNLEVRNRTSLWPKDGSCKNGNDGVDASCSVNSSYVEVAFTSRMNRPAATLLITDGEPTVSYDGVEPYEASVRAACLHRDTANLYVVGLGSGTDADFNNILAAAGGTGYCDSGADPCAAPSRWEDLRNKCHGGFQTGSEQELLAAISAITNDVQCLFDVNFSGAPVSDVPIDPTGSYPYLYVEGRFTALGNQRIYHKDSPLADPPGEGWEFASATESKRVRFTDSLCHEIQVRSINQVTTQLACLCEEVPGVTCTVPDSETLGVCPEGTWTCIEGVDVCQPDASCCAAGVPCTLDGLEGVCAQGLTSCPDPAGDPICEQVVFPSDEVCNDLDDDCDGDIDELDGGCSIPGGAGRCEAGYRVCSGGEEVCLPKFEPMPELCNGVDDDCDGTKDNITTSWNVTFKDIYTLPTADGPKACNIKNTCICAGGVFDDSSGTDFTSYLAEWDPVCECGAGLEATLQDEETADTNMEPAAGCSSTDGGLSPLLILGVVGLLRRRRD